MAGKPNKENKMKKIAWALSLGLLVAGAAQAALLYSDTFDNDGLETNEGTGGGIVNRTIYGDSWSETSNGLEYNAGATNYERRAAAYSENSFQSDGGFELTVNYFTSSIGDVAANLFSFGLVSTATDMSTYSGYNIFGTDTGVTALGVNITAGQVSRGLWYADGASTTLLDESGTTQQFVASTVTPVVISVEADGNGGADWSYSINGVTEASGNIATFDFASEYQFVTYAQDDGFTRYIDSVSVTSIPEPATIGMLGLGAIVTLAIRKHQRG
jgi:hypothetical protein